MHFYANLFDSLFVFFRNVFAVLGVVLALMVVLDWRRSEVQAESVAQGVGALPFDSRYRPSHRSSDGFEPVSRFRDGARELFHRHNP